MVSTFCTSGLSRAMRIGSEHISSAIACPALSTSCAECAPVGAGMTRSVIQPDLKVVCMNVMVVVGVVVVVGGEVLNYKFLGKINSTSEDSSSLFLIVAQSKEYIPCFDKNRKPCRFGSFPSVF